jgi:glycosyltransferase involved in cell wall biosynthesis
VSASLLLVVPCYNEAGRLNPDAFLQQLAAHSDLGFIFVDDGSVDETATTLQQLAAGSGGRISVVTLKQNAGKASAVRAGMLAAFEQAPAFAGYWDADLATPLEAIGEFMTVFTNRPDADIVIGSRVKLLGRDIRRSAFRHYSGRVFATAASMALGISVYDTQCGAKIFRVTDRAKRVFRDPFVSKWIFDVEILSRYVVEVGADLADERVYELPLARWTGVAGSKLKPWHAVRAIWDLIFIWRH